jgi:hypothetical protein
MNGASNNRAKYMNAVHANEISLVPLVLPTINSPGRKKSNSSIYTNINPRNNTNFKRITGH